MNADELLACPKCRQAFITKAENAYSCDTCGTQYAIDDGVSVFFRPGSDIVSRDSDRAEFWNSGWAKISARLLDFDHDAILKERQIYFDNLNLEGYPSVVDISSEQVAGKKFLNIGCGGGYEGLLFSGYGAQYIGIDFSHNAARFTQKIIDTAGFNGTTYQAEAEAPPFLNDSMDYIYSSGVLHHTPNTEQGLKEVYRVLKPGGTAMIGLYATYSIMFLWYRLHAVLRGNISKRAIEAWVVANTEGEWKVGERENRCTKTYSTSKFAKMLNAAGFSDCDIQQTSQQIKTIPIIGKIVTALLPAGIGNLRVGPVGSMLVATCRKR